MAQFDVPKGPKIETITLENFLGVDFTSIAPKVYRASNLINLVNNNGFLETRPGFDAIGNEFGIKAYYNMIINDSTIKWTAIRGGKQGNLCSIQLVNPNKPNQKLKMTEVNGEVIYYLATNNNGNIITTIQDILNMPNHYMVGTCETPNTIAAPNPQTFLQNGEDARINGIWNIDRDADEIFIIHVKNKLFELDTNFLNPKDLGITVADTITQYSSVILDNKLAVFDGSRAFWYGKSGGEWGIHYLDESGYIPTTSINRKPDGTGASSYEDANILNPYRENSFVADGTSGVYYVADPFDDEAPTARILNEDGTTSVLEIQSWNRNTGAITFKNIPPKFAVTGRDSVFIRYKVTTNDSNTGENIKEYINKCTIATTYGYNSNNTRLFISGNPMYPNVDWFSAEKNITYFPAENYTRIGFQPIINYLKLNDGTLAIQKKISDSDYAIYYRDSAIYNASEVFPIASGSKAVGCISKYANANLLNDPLTLTETGVYGVVGSSYNEKFVNERSYFIKTKLLKEPNLENAVAIVHHSKYYLAINNHVYVADGRYKSKVAEANASNYQYEWYYWEDVPVRIWFTYNDELYFATESGDICKFNDTVLNYNMPMKQLFDTAFLDLGSIVQSKTVRRVTVITRPYEDSEYTLSYITNEDEQDIINKQTPMGSFPATLQEKEKIKKVMYVKFRLYNESEKPMNFFKIGIEYIFSGRYRGD